MTKHIIINITENNCYDDNPMNSTLFVKTEKIEDIEDRIMLAYMDYVHAAGYKNDEEARDNGMYFGNSFANIPKEILDTYGFAFEQPDMVIEADFDRGIGYV